MKEDKPILEIIIDSIDAIYNYKPVTKAEFDEDVKTQDAILMRVEVIGESLRKLSEEFRDKYPKLPYAQAKGLRNIIAHEYGVVDLDQIWNLLEADFKEFEEAVHVIAADYGL